VITPPEYGGKYCPNLYKERNCMKKYCPVHCEYEVRGGA
jgi:hypothetical protein